MPQLDGAGADLAVTAEEHDHGVQDIAGKYRQCNAASQSDGSRGFGPIEIRIVEFLQNYRMPAGPRLAWETLSETESRLLAKRAEFIMGSI